MTDLSSEIGFRKNRQLGKAVYQNRALSKAGLSERLFALLFSGLVYPQIWEDPDIDIEAMDLMEGHRIVTIASGGCNVLAYLTRSPEKIDAVDLNAAHIALNRLKLAAVTHLPAQADLFRFFGEAGNRANSAAYDRFLAPNLDARTRRYWEGRSWRGRRRIRGVRPQFLPHRAFGPVHRRGPSSGPPLRRRPRENPRCEEPRRPAPLLRRGTRARCSTRAWFAWSCRESRRCSGWASRRRSMTR